MSDIALAIIKIWNDLVPSKDLPTPVWSARFLLLVVVTITSIYTLINIFGATEIGQQHGLKKVIDSPVETVIESVYRRRRIYGSMSRLMANHKEIQSVFVVTPYNQQQQAFDYKDPSKNDRVLLSQWLIRPPVDYYVFDLLETKFSQDLTVFKGMYPNIDKCVDSPLSTKSRDSLIKIFGKNFDSDAFGVCPIVDPKGFKISYTLVFHSTILPSSVDDISAVFFNQDFSTFTDEIRRTMLAPSNAFAK